MALVAGVALATLAGLVLPAHAQRGYGYPYGYGHGYGYGWNDGWYAPRTVNPARKFRSPPSRRETVNSQPQKDPGFGDMPKGPLQLVVSIDHQKVTLFSNGAPVAQGPVSTGVPGHPTPTGVFSIIEKDRYHRSNIYSNAPMPFMQRITWSGVALHEGVLPGYPASHGCIRMSHDFARKLWPVTKLGVRVVVARGDLAPVAFAHPKLFVPKPKPAGPAVAMNPASDGRGDAPFIALAQAMMPNAGSDASAAAQDVPAPGPAAEPSEDRRVAEPTQPAHTGDDAVKAAGAVEPSQPAEVDAPTAPADPRRSVETLPPGEPAMPAQVAPVAVEPTPTEAAPVANDIDKPAPAVDPAKPVAPRMKAADQPVKRTGQVAVFVSRKENRLFVRQGFIPLFDTPVEIDEPDQPLGTHVFTAIALTDNGAGVRWNLITFPTDGSPPVDETAGRRKAKELPRPAAQLKALKPPSTAAQALNRIQMPQEAIDRIGELLIPGSSLVVSDEGLGKETGRYTEFIVLGR